MARQLRRAFWSLLKRVMPGYEGDRRDGRDCRRPAEDWSAKVFEMDIGTILSELAKYVPTAVIAGGLGALAQRWFNERDEVFKASLAASCCQREALARTARHRALCGQVCPRRQLAS